MLDVRKLAQSSFSFQQASLKELLRLITRQLSLIPRCQKARCADSPDHVHGQVEQSMIGIIPEHVELSGVGNQRRVLSTHLAAWSMPCAANPLLINNAGQQQVRLHCRAGLIM